MCGIAGMMTTDDAPPPREVLDAMRGALAHRGPDGSGAYAASGTTLLQTRLAIIDLKTGDQPLYGPRDTALVANGEIYNYVELTGDFAASALKTHSDCELPLLTFARDGAGFAKSLRGMYAIALAEPAARSVHLARDPFGIKPLYYVQTPRGILFASEPQALIRTGLVPPTVRTQAATELLQLQFTTGRSTIFTGIERVLPGETLTLTKGHIEAKHRQPALSENGPLAIDEEAALKRLDAALMDSVLVHQRSDVPYGMFLSGGIDSTAVLACMARLNTTPVRAFTAAFPGTAAHDEREQAQRVAKAAGADHIEIEVTEADFWRVLPAVAAAMDDPASDYAILPTYLLAAEAAKSLKVVLTGEGGDELFAGYSRYRQAKRPWLLGGRRMRRRGFLDGLGVLRDRSRHWRDGIAAAERDSNDNKRWTRLQRAQAVDCADWLPNDLLLKLDRCLMAHGLEGRTPFLDPVVAQLAFRLPDRLKLARGAGKYLLRRWLANALPAADTSGRKRGFTVPVGEWLEPKAAQLAPLIARSEGVAQLCHPDKVAALFTAFGARGGKREATACWQLLFYALWHAAHIERRAVAHDVFAMLDGR